jgi:hypothetical protein
MPDQNVPNQASNKEKAEGDRADEHTGGITNRPLDQERENQEALPTRGRSKKEEGRTPALPADDASLKTKI